MDKDHVHRLSNNVGDTRLMKIDMDKELLTIERAKDGGYNAKMSLNPAGVKKASDGARFDFTLFGQLKNSWNSARYKLEIRNTPYLVTINSPKPSYNLTFQYSSSINKHETWTWDPFVVGQGGSRAYDVKTKTWKYREQVSVGFSEYELDFFSPRAMKYNTHA
jgi:hypothetical protein